MKPGLVIACPQYSNTRDIKIWVQPSTPGPRQSFKQHNTPQIKTVVPRSSSTGSKIKKKHKKDNKKQKKVSKKCPDCGSTSGTKSKKGRQYLRKASINIVPHRMDPLVPGYMHSIRSTDATTSR